MTVGAMLEEIERAAFNPVLHPRAPKGRRGGGRFASKPGAWLERASRRGAHNTGELKKLWARLDLDLLPYAGKPDAPEARRLIAEQKAVVKLLHHQHLDTGLPGDVGVPGDPRDVVVVGAGPAGLSASIYGATQGLDTLLVDSRHRAGGQAGFSSRIENMLGFPAGITGKQLASKGLEQAERTGADVRLGVRVEGMSYDKKTGMKTVRLSDGRSVKARAVIIAGGVQFSRLKFPGSDSPDVCYGDSALVKSRCRGKPVVIIGAGNAAAQAAVDAAQNQHVTMLVRHGTVRGQTSSYMADQVEAHPNITILPDTEIARAKLGSGERLEAVETKDGRTIPCGAVGVFVGSRPETDWASGVDRDERGLIRTGGEGRQPLETNIPGVFAAGDVREGAINRVITAAADGSAAISYTNDYLKTAGERGGLEEAHRVAVVRAAATLAPDAADRWLDEVDALDREQPYTCAAPSAPPRPGVQEASSLSGVLEEIAQRAFNPALHPRARGGRWAKKLAPAREAASAKGVDLDLAFAPHNASPQHGLRAEFRMRAAAAILESGTAIPDAVLHLPDETARRRKIVKAITTGDVGRAQKEYADTPVGDLEILGGVRVEGHPVHGQAHTNAAARSLTMGSSSVTGDFRHELGHALRAAWSGHGAPSAHTPLTDYVSSEHKAALARVAANIAAGKPKPKTEPEWEEKLGIIDPRALDSWDEDFAEQYRAYHRQVYRSRHPEAPDYDPLALAKYRQNHPGWAKVWDAWYTAQLAGRTAAPAVQEAVLEEIAQLARFNPALHPRLKRGRGGGEFMGKAGTVRRERDAVGEFAAPRGGFQSRLDRHIVDYERPGTWGPGDPGRSLSRGRDVEAVGRLLHGARHVGYSETPFFARLERLQGTDTPGRMTGLAHQRARDALFAKQPLERIPLDPRRVVFTQPNVNRAAVLKSEARPTSGSDPAYAVRYGGRFYVMDGHHRMLAAAARREASYPARVLDLGGS